MPRRVVGDRRCRTSAANVILAFMVAICGSWAKGEAQGSDDLDNYIAKAGDVFISEREFVQRFEMLPGLYRHRVPQLEEAKLEFLYSMIAEKLLAQEAIARGFEGDSVVQSAFAEARALLARDELYREQVSNSITITPQEVANGMKQARKQMLVAFAYFDREEEAQFVRGQMRNSTDFDLMNIDSSLEAMRDTATVIWGDADPDIERAAYKLKQGEVSPVVVAGPGFYILRILKVFTNGFYASMQPDVLRERVIAKIRQRKERLRAADVVDEILKDKVGRSLPGSFHLLANVMTDVFRDHARDSTISMTPELASVVRRQLGSAVTDTLVEAGVDRWTIDHVIDRLVSRQFSVPAAHVTSVPLQLNAEIRLMVQQELLGQDALARGLDNVPSVRRQLEMWQSAYLADMMRDYVRRRVSVSDAEVYAYLHSKDPATVVPQVQIRELRTSSISEMHEALLDLEGGLSFEKTIEKWSNDSTMKSRLGVSNFFPITDRPPVGEIASQMEIGQRYGPVRVSGGVLYFELLARKPSAHHTIDTASTTREQSARVELLRMKQKRMLDLFLAQVGHERGFAIYEDRLKKISVSPVPMMTFRMLGFGGRMFAVPFVPKDLEWLDIEPPNEKVLP